MAELSPLGQAFNLAHRGSRRKEMPWWKQMLIVAAAKPVIEGVSETVGEVGKSIFLGTGGKDVFDTARGRQLNLAAAQSEKNITDVAGLKKRLTGNAPTLQLGVFDTLQAGRLESVTDDFMIDGRDNVAGQAALSAYMESIHEELTEQSTQIANNIYEMEKQIQHRPSKAQLKQRAESGDHWYAQSSVGRWVSKMQGRFGKDGLTQDERETKSLKYMAYGDRHREVDDEAFQSYLSGEAGLKLRDQIRTMSIRESDEAIDATVTGFAEANPKYGALIRDVGDQKKRETQASMAVAYAQDKYASMLRAIYEDPNSNIKNRADLANNIANMPGKAIDNLLKIGISAQLGAHKSFFEPKEALRAWRSIDNPNHQQAQQLDNQVTGRLLEEVGLELGINITDLNANEKVLYEGVMKQADAWKTTVLGNSFTRDLQEAYQQASDEMEGVPILDRDKLVALQQEYLTFNFTSDDPNTPALEGNFGYISAPTEIEKGWFRRNVTTQGRLGTLSRDANIEFLKQRITGEKPLPIDDGHRDIARSRMGDAHSIIKSQQITAVSTTVDSGYNPVHPDGGTLSDTLRPKDMTDAIVEASMNYSDDPNEQQTFAQNNVKGVIDQYINGAINNNYVNDDGTPRLFAPIVKNIWEIENKTYAELQLGLDTPSVVSATLEKHGLSLAHFGIKPTEDIDDTTEDEPLFDITDMSDKNLQQMIDNSSEFESGRAFAGYNLEEIKELNPKILNSLMTNYAEQLSVLSISEMIEAAKKGTEVHRQVREKIDRLPNSLLITLQELMSKHGMNEREAYEEILRVNTPDEIMRLQLTDSKTDWEKLKKFISDEPAVKKLDKIIQSAEDKKAEITVNEVQELWESIMKALAPAIARGGDPNPWRDVGGEGRLGTSTKRAFTKLSTSARKAFTNLTSNFDLRSLYPEESLLGRRN